LAGAGKTYGHRSLYPGHDRANFGNGYSNAILKGPFKPKKNIFSYMSGQARMSALNLTKFVHAYCETGLCKMGEVTLGEGNPPTTDIKKCSCSSKSRAFEWRVWNSQTNPRIIYAWIALMQAVHAHSWRPPTRAYIEFEDMPSCDWAKKAFNKLTKEQQTVAQERVAWMFSELPLTSDEKDALAYTFMRTPYKVWGAKWFKEQAATPYRPCPYPNTYESNIERKIVIPKDDGLPRQPGTTTNTTNSYAQFVGPVGPAPAGPDVPRPEEIRAANRAAYDRYREALLQREALQRLREYEQRMGQPPPAHFVANNRVWRVRAAGQPQWVPEDQNREGR
jgi:hypothetical protein